MLSFSPIMTCTSNIVRLSGHAGRQMTSQVYAMIISGNFCSHGLRRNCHSSGSAFSKWRRNWHPLAVKSSANSIGQKMTYLGTSSSCQNIRLRLLVPKQEWTKVGWYFRAKSLLRGGASAGLIFGLLVCFASFNPVYAAVAKRKTDNKDVCESSMTSSHGKKVYTDYSITGIPGDGRCLFRSVAHGACLRSSKPSPSESLQRELADELRTRVADEFVKRREETEWMPITVYMYDEDAGGLIAIAEYGQEYGKEDPIRVLYHGLGHYDALQIPGKKNGRSRL
ncbi:OVARIAN TUMOR DOMAIN-containing deubiquitinating enzyme 4-like isoform X2 [Macadamia integrifolia]|uniref:OVARIAN TUMOR DOMAIN-containing deubiquitinating enzyme 4-like isoform X2 n=1 Tax=Macadamia integrifolia TaxID=60698 RepID=UPI001C52C837|nr:OVARIAN TUMOR DOMAIN-containing deubiquitinating enzyme 4-like isoform X2 [Macadamia integrifolia]